MPDNGEPDFSAYPRDHVVGLLATPEQAAAAVEDLTRTGDFGEDDVTLLCCDEGRERLDVTGARRGPVGRVLRVLQRIGPEHEYLTRYATALDDGELLIAVRSGQDRKRSAADILAAHGAHDLSFYGFRTVETL